MAGIDKQIPQQFFSHLCARRGTPFEEVGDTGEGQMTTDGLAFAKRGQNRIIWALVEAINNVHIYYRNDPLIDSDKFKAKFNRLSLPSFRSTRYPITNTSIEIETPKQPIELLEAAFSEALKELHNALSSFVPFGPQKSKDKGIVTQIYVSMFGFSRGASEARVFANWFVWSCQLDSKRTGKPGLSLGTIPVTFDFLGLFDTVASVGLASSAPVWGAHGHHDWADAEYSLKLPDPGPGQCLHLMSAHEVRRSFPLESILYKGILPKNCKEMVFPGVHSDIGGGYVPKDQGRGKDAKGADLLSRITLSVMYRAARLAGVPLKLEEAFDAVKDAFKVDPTVIKVFNAYVLACVKPGDNPEKSESEPLHLLMAQQHKLYIQWRKKMAGKMEQLQSVKDSDAHARLDIVSADNELKEEIAQFEAWRRGDKNIRAHLDGAQTQDHSWPEWETIGAYWDDPTPNESVTNIFDQFVHDSRAWFKPLGRIFTLPQDPCRW